MRLYLLLFFCIATSSQSFAQSFLPPIFFNGIDTFFIGDKESKYIDTNREKHFFVQTDTINGEIFSSYNFKKDSLHVYKIDTISFRNMFFTFSNSILDGIHLSSYYSVKDYENAVKHVESKMKFLKNYISNCIHKKGKAKRFITTNTYRNYGYEWKNKDYIITLSIQFGTPTSRFIFLILYITNKNEYN